MKICIVIANYYPKVSKELLFGALKVLKTNGIKQYKIFHSTSYLRQIFTNNNVER